MPDVQLGYLYGGWLTMGMVLSFPMLARRHLGAWRRPGRAPTSPASRPSSLPSGPGARRPLVNALSEISPTPSGARARSASTASGTLPCSIGSTATMPRRDPFGRGGDFVTAPEVSQMFGELIGAWVASAWARLGRPSPFVLAELGPGRGTLMADILRTLRRVAPRCMRAAKVRLVEVSDRLAAVQADAAGALRPADPARAPGEAEPDRRSSSPTNCSTRWRSASSSSTAPTGASAASVGDDGRFEFVPCEGRRQVSAPRSSVRPRRAESRRDAGSSRRHARRSPPTSPRGSPPTAARRSSSTTAMPAPATATRCRRCTATPLPTSLAEPGENDITSHVDFAAPRRPVPRGRALGLAR